LLALEQAREATCLAIDGVGALAGFALLNPRYCNLFFEVEAVALSTRLEVTLLDWGIARFRQYQLEGKIARENALEAKCDERDLARVALIEGHGFAAQDLLTLHFERNLIEPIPRVSLPEGFSLRSLTGEHEVDAIFARYHAAYDTQTTNREDVLAIQCSSG
jgi:hypothetical protein